VILIEVGILVEVSVAVVVFYKPYSCSNSMNGSPLLDALWRPNWGPC